MIGQQPTLLGEPNGRMTTRLQDIKAAFEGAGFHVDVTSRIDAWLKTHAVFVTCMESAIYRSGGDNRRLADSQSGLLEMVVGVREGFRALQALGIPVVPFKLKVMFLWMPKSYPLRYWRGALRAKLGEYSLAAHTNASTGEVRELVGEVRALVRSSSSVPTPAMDRLFSWVEQ